VALAREWLPHSQSAAMTRFTDSLDRLSVAPAR
jgi:hypothetical protein